MKLPTGLRAFQSLRDVAGTIADMSKAIASGWAVDHNPNGTHKFSWVDLPHDATRYFGSGSMTFGVSSGDQLLCTYRIAGDSCLFAWRVATANCSGGGNRLRIRLPNGIRPRTRVAGVHYYDDAGTEGIGLARIDATLQTVDLFKTNSASFWTNTAAKNTYTEGSLEFPITQ